MNFATWETAKKLMLPFDGGASQIHMLGLSKSEFSHALNSIDSGTTESKVTLLANSVMEPCISLKDLNSNIDLFNKVVEGHSTISTALFETAIVTFDFWSEPKKEALALEIWFWADQLFSDNEVENKKRFSVLLDLLKTIAPNGECQCILTPNEASDPLEDLEKGNAVLLDIMRDN